MTKLYAEFSLLFFSTGKYDCEIKKLNTWFYSTMNNLVII